MRAAVAQAVGCAPPASCQLLGFRTGSQEGRSELWVLRADEPLQIGSHVKPDIQTSIPVDILRTIVQDVAQADANMSAPAATRCDYCGVDTRQAERAAATGSDRYRLVRVAGDQCGVGRLSGCGRLPVGHAACPPTLLHLHAACRQSGSRSDPAGPLAGGQ